MINLLLTLFFGAVMLVAGGLLTLFGIDKFAPDLYAEFKRRINEEDEKDV